MRFLRKGFRCPELLSVEVLRSVSGRLIFFGGGRFVGYIAGESWEGLIVEDLFVVGWDCAGEPVRVFASGDRCK